MTPCPDCAGKGWEIFNAPYPSTDVGGEIQRCDTCRRHPSDEVAASYARMAGVEFDYPSLVVTKVPHE